MTLIRRLILALALMAGLSPAIAQVPPPVPALPDAERRTVYAITASTCACNVNFALYGDGTDYQNWVEVWLNGVQMQASGNWTITSPSGSLGSIARPISDAVLTFTAAQTGTVQVIGARKPRRTSQFAENRGVPARDFNQVLTDIISQNREIWDKTNSLTGRGLFFAPGVSISPLPVPSACANQYLAFDGSSNPICGPPQPPPTPVVCVTADCSAGFGGRLTLISGKPSMDADAISSQTLWYAPDGGNAAPVLVSGAFTQFAFTSSTTDQIGLALSLAGSANWAAGTIHDVFLIRNAGSTILATRQWDAAMQPSAQTLIPPVTTITSQTGATPWTRASAAFDGNLAKATAASATLAANTGYGNCLGQDWGAGVTKVVTQVVVTTPTDNTLVGNSNVNFAQEGVRVFGSNDNTNWQTLVQPVINANVANGTAFTIPINPNNQLPFRYIITCIQGDSGGHGANVSQIQFYTVTAPSTRRLTKFNGILVNDAVIAAARISAASTVSVAQYEGSYLGSIAIDAGGNGAVTCNFTYGPSRVCNIFNMYHQRTMVLQAGLNTTITSVDSSSSYALTTPANIAWGPIQGSTAFSLSVLIGYTQDPFTVDLIRAAYLNTAAGTAPYESAIGVDTTAGFCGTGWSTTSDVAGPAIGQQGTSSCTLLPFFGTHTFYGIERVGPFTGTGAVSAFKLIQNSRLRAAWRG